jgi:large subunit ribosomal protein L1
MHGKRYTELKALIDNKKSYSIEEAIDLAKKTASTKFDGPVEVHVKVGIDATKGDQQVRANVTLPHGTGRTMRIAAFVGNEEKSNDAKAAGAQLVGGEELIAQIATSGKIEFDIAVATPDMMPKLAKVAKILGPKGLMPSPKNETVSTNIKKAIEELLKGKIAFKNDDGGNVHLIIGKASFSKEQLVGNFQAFVEALRKAKPASSKGAFIGGITVHAAMGPGIKVSA